MSKPYVEVGREALRRWASEIEDRDAAYAITRVLDDLKNAEANIGSKLTIDLWGTPLEVNVFHDGYRLYAYAPGENPECVFEWKHGNYKWSSQVASAIMKKLGVPELSNEEINALYKKEDV